MNYDPNDIKNGELDESRLTAYALEQLEGAERAAVEALLAESDRSRHTVEEIRSLAAEVKKAALQEPLASRSPQLRAVLEQYLSNEEATEMDAKPEPSSAEAPRRGRRRSTLIWAAAACALVAAIPAYVLISGSMGPDLRPVALDTRVAETPLRSMVADEELILRKPSREDGEAGAFLVGESLGDVSGLEAAGVSVEGKSNSARRRMRGQVAGEGAAPMKGEKASQVFGRRVDESNSVAGPAKPEPKRAAEQSHHVAGTGSVTIGKEDPGVFSADLDIPFSKKQFGLQVPQAGGMDDRLADTDLLVAPGKGKGTPPINRPATAGKQPEATHGPWAADAWNRSGSAPAATSEGVTPKLNKNPYPGLAGAKSAPRKPQLQAGGEVPVFTNGGMGGMGGMGMGDVVTPTESGYSAVTPRGVPPIADEKAESRFSHEGKPPAAAAGVARGRSLGQGVSLGRKNEPSPDGSPLFTLPTRRRAAAFRRLGGPSPG